MSFYFTLYIGPYVEWKVRLGRKPLPSVSEEPWYETLLAGQSLDLLEHDGIPEVKEGRVRYARYRFVPNQERPNAPPRSMSFVGGMANREEDWSWINPLAEMDWFSEAFADELAILEKHFGGPPRMGWGVETSF